MTYERADITCPKDGAPIPLGKLSISKWSDQLYLVHCPRCGAFHQFVPVARGERVPQEGK
jgi:hypothetical protein